MLNIKTKMCNGGTCNILQFIDKVENGLSLSYPRKITVKPRHFKQWCQVTKYMYFVTVLEYYF